jgi:predicted transcriptional regulator
MPRLTSIRLSDKESSLLQMLWSAGAVTLSEAHAAMCEAEGDIGYTTVQTRLDRLVEKGAVKKSAERPARYSAALKPEEVSRPLLAMLAERVSGAVPLVAHLVSDPAISDGDLKEMKRLIAAAERARKTKDA